MMEIMNTKFLLASALFAASAASALGQNTTLTPAWSSIQISGGLVGYPTTYGSNGVSSAAVADDSYGDSFSSIAVTWSVDLQSSNDEDDQPPSAFEYFGTFTNYASGAIQLYTAGSSADFTTYVANNDATSLDVPGSFPTDPMVHATAGPDYIETGDQYGSVGWIWTAGQWYATYNVVTYDQDTTESLTDGGTENPNLSAAGTQQYWAATLVSN